ncbi:MAG: squalene synthase HpnC [Bacteroidota bacterium]
MFVNQTDHNRGSWTLERAYRYCAEVAREHYENFPVGSLIVPKSKRPYLHAIYAFARAADDFADEPGRTPAERLSLLGQWELYLTDAYSGKASHPVFVALADTVSTLDIPIEPLQRLLAAFKMDVTKNRYETFDEVLSYCQHSANPVGELVLLVFGLRDPALIQLSDHICTALQLTNFWQDVWIDGGRDRVYLPQEDLQRFGYTVEDLARRRDSKDFRSLLQFELHRTRDIFLDGAPLISLLEGRLRFEVKLIWLGGWRLLEKIESANCDMLHRRPTISPLDKAWILLRSLTMRKLLQ